ncbi:hypothetical protein PROP_02226 [Propionicimonas sp. T2.31MG-18]|uniref:hypothetical protein n=1 Tax=Propionicimonas sp. T2.31MG-18 TaxID=3157620 RepID=UPI0035E64BBC
MLRMLVTTSPADGVILVVEGPSDVRALRPLVNPGVHIQALGGKSLVVGAHQNLGSAHERRVLFLVDCDNEDNTPVKGLPNLIITSHRDLECDLLFHLDGAKRAALDCFSSGLDHESVVKAIKKELVVSTEVACRFNATKDEARLLQLPLGIRDVTTGKKRRFALEDLPRFEEWAQGTSDLRIPDIAARLGEKLGWTTGQVALVANAAVARWGSACKRHSVSACASCGRMRLCNGHDLEAALVARFNRQGSSITRTEMERLVRVGADVSLANGWPVVDRIRRFEGWAGLRVLRTL